MVILIPIQVLILILVLGRIPMRMIALKSPLLQVMILVTPMMLPLKFFWAKAARGVWGMAHVFDGKLYFIRDHMQGNFIPKNLKLPEPKPAPKPRAKASLKGIFKWRTCAIVPHGV